MTARSCFTATRDVARIKLLALSWTRKAIEHIGILIRDEARIVEGRYKFTEKQVAVGRSLAADRRSKSKTLAKKGQGDRGDQKRASR